MIREFLALEIEIPRTKDRFARPGLLVRELFLEDRRFQLNTEQARALFDVGRFRAVQVADLRRFCTRGEDKAAVDKNLQSLIKQSLLVKKIITSPLNSGKLEILTPTTTGRKLLEHAMEGSDQRFYEKLVKRREVVHDTAIYRMFQIESERIWKNGGYINRVVLDHELKAGIFSALQKEKQNQGKISKELQAEVAERFQLAVIDGKIPLPDLRIEYRSASGEERHIDLEISTGHYKAGQLATKARAGFRIYRMSSSSRLGGTPHGEDLLREVFSR